MTLNEKRKILDEGLTAKDGSLRFGSILFLKKNGEKRKALILKYSSQGFSSGNKDLVQKNTTAHKPEIYTAWDVRNKKFIKFNLNNILSLKVKGVKYRENFKVVAA